jgi:hypothetical protein
MQSTLRNLNIPKRAPSTATPPNATSSGGRPVFQPFAKSLPAKSFGPADYEAAPTGLDTFAFDLAGTLSEADDFPLSGNGEGVPATTKMYVAVPNLPVALTPKGDSLWGTRAGGAFAESFGKKAPPLSRGARIYVLQDMGEDEEHTAAATGIRYVPVIFKGYAKTYYVPLQHGGAATLVASRDDLPPPQAQPEFTREFVASRSPPDSRLLENFVKSLPALVEIHSVDPATGAFRDGDVNSRTNVHTRVQAAIDQFDKLRLNLNFGEARISAFPLPFQAYFEKAFSNSTGVAPLFVADSDGTISWEGARTCLVLVDPITSVHERAAAFENRMRRTTFSLSAATVFIKKAKFDIVRIANDDAADSIRTLFGPPKLLECFVTFLCRALDLESDRVSVCRIWSQLLSGGRLVDFDALPAALDLIQAEFTSLTEAKALLVSLRLPKNGSGSGEILAMSKSSSGKASGSRKSPAPTAFPGKRSEKGASKNARPRPAESASDGGNDPSLSKRSKVNGRREFEKKDLYVGRDAEGKLCCHRFHLYGSYAPQNQRGCGKPGTKAEKGGCSFSHKEIDPATAPKAASSPIVISDEEESKS